MSELNRAERMAVERVLAFANLERITRPELAYDALTGTKMYSQTRRQDVRLMPPSYIRNKAMSDTEAVSFLKPHLAKVERLLQDFAANPRAARRRNSRELTQLAKNGMVMAAPSYRKSRVAFDLNFMPSNIEGAYGFGLALLYDSTRPFGENLARCHLETCEKWFLRLARGSGGRKPLYCLTEHQRAADRLRGADRAREWRRAQKEAPK